MIHRYKPPSESEDKKKQARQIYWGTFAGTSLLFLAGLWATLDMDWADLVLSPGLLVLLYALWTLGDSVATWACRFAGVSQQGGKGGIIERDARAALSPYLSEAPTFEIKRGLGASLLVDREGIEFKRDASSKSERKRVLWREVQSCAFVTMRNVMGAHDSATLVLRDAQGRTLLHLSPTEEQMNQLLPAIRFYLRGEETEQTPNGSKI